MRFHRRLCNLMARDMAKVDHHVPYGIRHFEKLKMESWIIPMWIRRPMPKLGTILLIYSIMPWVIIQEVRTEKKKSPRNTTQDGSHGEKRSSRPEGIPKPLRLLYLLQIWKNLECNFEFAQIFFLKGHKFFAVS